LVWEKANAGSGDEGEIVGTGLVSITMGDAWDDDEFEVCYSVLGGVLC
jgi:hypothetical protein